MRFAKYTKVFKFLMSGGLAAGTEYLTFFVLHELGVVLLLANAMSFMGGLVVSFLLNKHWVFSHKGAASRQFGMYVTLAVINLLISSGIIYVLVHTAQLSPLVAKLGVMALIASWNYIIFRNVIFKKTMTG